MPLRVPDFCSASARFLFSECLLVLVHSERLISVCSPPMLSSTATNCDIRASLKSGSSTGQQAAWPRWTTSCFTCGVCHTPPPRLTLPVLSGTLAAVFGAATAAAF